MNHEPARQPIAPPPEPEAEPASPGRPRRFGPAAWLAAAAAVVLAVWLARRPGGDGAEAAKGSAPRPVPVEAVAAGRGRLPIVLDALGTVEASNTVTIRSRVDGELVRIAFEEGQAVKPGDLLAEIDPRPFQAALRRAKAQLARDAAQLRVAEGTLERYRGLLDKRFVSEQQVDEQAGLVAQLRGAVRMDEAAVASAELELAYTRIVAPIPGRVGLRRVDVGNVVRASDTEGIVVLTQMQPISVLFTIPEDDLPAVLERLRAGDRPPVEAWDRGRRTKLATGELLTVDNQIDPTTGTSRLKATFENVDGSLFPNQFVNVRLSLGEVPDAVLLPVAAIQRGPDGPFVYVVAKDRTAEVRPVATGAAEGGRIAVESGVDAGELVVVDGAEKLRAGSPLELREPPPAAPAERHG